MPKVVAPAPSPKINLVEVGMAYVEMLEGMRRLYRTLQVAEKELKDDGAPVADTIALYARIYTAHEKVGEVEKHLQALKDHFNKSLLPTVMDDAEISTTTISEGHRATRTQRIFASIPAANRQAAYQWLKDNGAAELVQETVNASSLSSYASHLAEENKVLPDDLFTVSTVESISLTRAKGWSMAA